MATRKRASRVSRAPGTRARRKTVKKTKNPGVKMRKAPRGWIKAKAVRTVRRGGRTIVEIKR